MTSTIDDLYLEWLYSQFGAVSNRNPAHSHWHFARQLYIKEFVWFVPNDENRAEDALELRLEFLAAQGMLPANSAWLDLGCSVLELLVVLSRKGSFETDESPEIWFWRMIDHSGLNRVIDAQYTEEVFRQNDSILDTIIHRTYSPSGLGGFFPLKHTRVDQRKIELWYQMSAWIIENHI